MDQGIGLQFPTTQPAHRMFFSNLLGIFDLNSQFLEQTAHGSVDFFWAEVPEFNGQVAAGMPQHLNTNPRGLQIAKASCGNDNSLTGTSSWELNAASKESIAQ